MTTTSLTIRAFVPGDIPDLSRIWHQASLGAHGFLGRARLDEQRQLIETVYLPAAETWVAETWVAEPSLAERGPVPLGFISLLDDVVGGLFVDPVAQGQGIGGALLDHALALKGGLALDVYTANAGAMAFYRARGFHEVSRQPMDGQGLPFAQARLVR
ncbi:MAG: GNAT family N-acetyltransferase [Paracoccus sp. (in: a-proteobacteria)]|uniref:GNAT family N-acetyltransferase n=1 Tax=Paracoccus sp. TaxID=267 RepID=UPI00391916A6